MHVKYILEKCISRKYILNENHLILIIFILELYTI